jgi:hypothetical protein
MRKVLFILHALLITTFSHAQMFVNSYNAPVVPLAIGSTVNEFTAAQTEASNLNPANVVNTPGAWYKNGKTYQSYMRADIDPYANMPSLFVYDKEYGLLRPFVTGKARDNADTHPYPPITWVGDRMYISQENAHASPVELYEAWSDNDYSAFKKLVETVGTQMGYPSFFPNGSNYFMFGREQTGYKAVVYKSTNGMKSWGSVIEITNGPGGLGGRHYTTCPFNNTRNGRIAIEITRRDETNNTWVQKYYAESSDGETWYNYSGSFSKNVVSSGAITQTELDNNFLVFTTGSNSVQGYAPRSCITTSGKFFSIAGNGIGNYIFIYHNGTSFATKSVSGISDLVDSGDIGLDPLYHQNSPFVALFERDSRLYLICRRTVGGFHKLFLYYSTDEGDSWNLVGDLFPGKNYNLFLAGIPFNIKDIPNNTNFSITGFSVDTNPCVTLINRLAFGTVQTETTPSITPVSALTDISDLARHYKISASTITNTGTTCNSLIDQSGNGQNATSSGSPVLDNGTTPTQVTFDNTNDVFDVPTTGINALDGMTLMAVVRKKDTSTNSAGIIFSTADAADAQHYLTCQIRKDAGFNSSLAIGHQSGASPGAITVYGDEDASDNTAWKIVTFKITSTSYLMYLNGKVQIFNISPNTLRTYRAVVGNFQDEIGGIDNIKIGALFRNTNAFSDFELKEWAMWSRPITETERRQAEKKLSNDYTITLSNEYQ